MGKHKTLNDTIFRNSKYMDVVNKQTKCDFRKEHKQEYDFMLDTFSSFILLYNCFNSDSNLSLSEKVENALNVCEKYLFSNYNENEKEIDGDDGINKYSVRFIQNVCEKHSTHLYRRINEWYNDYLIIYTPNSKLDFFLDDLDKEMSILEKVSFDDMLKENINYKKNKNSNYKIYMSKFSYLYSNNEEFENHFIKEYNDNHIAPLSDKELANITLIYDLVARCCNAITIGLENKPIEEYNINERTTPTEFLNIYLKTLDININTYEFRMNAIQFMLEFLMIYQDVSLRDVSMNEMINNYDFYYFMVKMQEILKDENFTITDEQIRKDLEDLKVIYNVLHTPIQTMDDTLNNLSKAFDLIQKLMNKKRIQDYFIRVS